MNKTTEALKLAEEALYNTGNALMCLTTTRKLRPMYQEMRDDATEGCNKALAAIREALADHPMDYDQGFVDGVEAQLADPVKQEPVSLDEVRRIAAEYAEPNSQVDSGNLYWALCEALKYAAPVSAKRERYFCERCGKRVGDNNGAWEGVHTCTPPEDTRRLK